MEKNFIVIVEDDHLLGTTFAEILEMEGYHIKLIGDGQEALNYFKVNTPPLVILDLNLPGVSGVEILLYIRSNERTKEMKVIVVSADARASELVSESADLQLSKPISLDTLLSFIQRLI